MVKWPIVLLISVMPVTHAFDHESETGAPSMELLEFLGEWETKDGSWMDPLQIEDMVETGWNVKDIEESRNE